MLKKILFLSIILSSFIIACKPAKKIEENDNTPIAKKYAKYRVCLYNTVDLKGCKSVLYKAEPVDILKVAKEDVKNDSKNVLRVKTTDDKIKYIMQKHLANQPIVFMKDIAPHVRNNSATSTYGMIPKGSIGFIIGEKGSWTQIYVGRVKGKYIDKKWVKNDTYITTEDTLKDALQYDRVISVFNKLQANKKVKADKIKDVKEILTLLKQKTNIFAELANALELKWAELDKKKEDDEKKQDDADKAPDMKSDKTTPPGNN